MLSTRVGLQSGLALFGLLLSLDTVIAGDVAGRVVNADNEIGLSGAEVVVSTSGRRVYADSNGHFRINNLTAGEHALVVTYPGTQPREAVVNVGETGIVRLDVIMTPLPGITEEMVVVGQRASQASALARQRNSDAIASFLTRDAIGQFPDQNVSEAVRRLPGVSVQNDQGEGRFIVLRGLDPNLNSASLNGVRVTSPESDIRAVALDVVPAELVESIEVQKSLLPEMDGDAIGGAIDIRTTSALDRQGSFLAITGTGSYNELMDKTSPKIGIDASTVINERFGLSVGLAYFDRSLGSKNVESEDWTDADGIVFAESFELRDYDVERERIGATIGLDWLATENTTLEFRGVYSSFEDQEYRSRVSLDFGDAQPVSGTSGSALFNLSGDEELSVERDIKDRNEKQEITSLLIGGETFAGAWTYDYQVSFTQSEEDESDSFDPTVFERTFEVGELSITQVGIGSDAPGIRVPEAFVAAFTDATTYEFDSTERVNGLAEDEETAFRVNAARDFVLGDSQAQLKFGAVSRSREKSYALDLAIFDGFDGDGEFLLADVSGRVDFPLSDINPVPSASAVRRALGDLSEFELNVAESQFENAAAAYTVEEDILAGYAQMRIEQGPWLVIGGVRLEQTDNEIRGNRVDFVEAGATFNGAVVDEDTTFVAPVRFSRDDSQWLPSLNLKYSAQNNLVLRAAAYRSIFRPNIQDLAPRFVVEQDDGDEREGEFGNPELDPYVAWNLDVSAEWYFQDSAVLQAGLFYKDIDDFIIRKVIEDVDFNGVFVDEGVIPDNGDSAEVLGVELNFQQALTQLPAPFDGLLIGLNYTYVDSEGEFGERTISLPGTSEHVLNVTLGYEKGPLSMRLGWVYRDEYLDEVSSDGETDRYVDEHATLDFTARYDVNNNLQVFLEAINLTDEPFVAFQRTPEYGDRAMQYEEYSFTVNVGLRAVF
ncbi:MAG: TonB-dependent receptor [bacterium]